MTSSFQDWAGLPEHLLDLFVSKFGPLSDYFCFSAVCSQWRNVVNLDPSLDIFFNVLKLSSKKIPMLMIKTEENNDEKRSLYNVLNKITYNVQLPFPYRYRFIGSSHGWLICLDKNLVITLLDPFNNGCISLPVFRDACQVYIEEWDEPYFDYYIKKAILTSDPRTDPNNYEVAVIYHGMSKLAYYKSNKHCWTYMNLVPEKEYISSDIISYGGYVYSVTYSSELLQIDFHSGTAKTVVPASKRESDKIYLVESQSGELLLVKRFWNLLEGNNDIATKDMEIIKTNNFKVFKLVHSSQKELATWEEIEHIGDQALFVGGTNHSVSVSTEKCSKFCPNSIYYTPHDYLDILHYDYQGVHEDSGIFNLEDKTFHSHQVLASSDKYIQPPFWFVPNFK